MRLWTGWFEPEGVLRPSRGGKGWGRLRMAAAFSLLLTTGVTSAGPGGRVLFIGNSLTAWNDLPLLVEAMAKAKGLPLSCESVTYDDVSLEDHWNRGTPDVIHRGGFKHVVLQQGPSSLLPSRENLREWTRRFAERIRASGAVPALFMVWPDRSRLAFFPQVRESYRLAASDAGGVFLAAGDTWVAAWAKDPGLALYGPDDFHPSRLGTYAAAATIFGGLTGLSPLGLPHRLKLRNGLEYSVDSGQAAFVLSAAAEVSGRAPR